MTLSEKQRERLWAIMKGANVSDEWLMHYGEYLCDNIASLIEHPRTVEVVRDVHHYTPPPSSGMDFVTGMVVGSLLG